MNLFKALTNTPKLCQVNPSHCIDFYANSSLLMAFDWEKQALDHITDIITPLRLNMTAT